MGCKMDLFNNLLDPITHQQIVNDTMFMGVSTIQEAHALKALLHDVMLTSCMTINPSKYQVFFFNTHPHVQAHLARVLGFQFSTLPIIYLRAPLI